MENETLIIVALNAIALVFGIVFGGGGVLMVLARINQNVELLNKLESIVQATATPEQAAIMNEAAQAVASAANTLAKITDGLPNEAAPPDGD